METVKRLKLIEALARVGLEPFTVAKNESGTMVIYPPVGAKGGTRE